MKQIPTTRRTLLASSITGGGLVSAIAFFLPWVVVSCEDTSTVLRVDEGAIVQADEQDPGVVGFAAISPYNRAVGVELEPSGSLRPIGPPDEAGPDPRYFALLVGSLLIVALGGLAGIATSVPVRPVGAAALVTALVALSATVVIGLQEKLGVRGWSTPGFALHADPAWGVWLAVAGHSLAAAGALLTLVLGGGAAPCPALGGPVGRPAK